MEKKLPFSFLLIPFGPSEIASLSLVTEVEVKYSYANLHKFWGGYQEKIVKFLR
jgi:hypothetical protein